MSQTLELFQDYLNKMEQYKQVTNQLTWDMYT